MENYFETIHFDEKIIEEYFDRLWPICRSITGEGFRKSLDILSEIIPLEKVNLPSGKKVLDWTIPKEWNIQDAFIADSTGKRIIDFKENNLHVLNYSVPVDKMVSLDELKANLHTLPDIPHAIPYVTSYYKERWGFCLSLEQLNKLLPGLYHVKIDSELKEGNLTYGHLFLPATVPNPDEKEVLISSYLCHPSLANNELSGPLVTAFLYDCLKEVKIRHLNYRFIIIPETIGSLAFLSQWGEHLKQKCVAGLVATCCGDPGLFTYKKTRQGQSLIDRCALLVLKKYEKSLGEKFKVYDFFPLGSDERQYCSPGFNLPVGSLMRTMYGEYQEYHTSLDNKDFISFPAMMETIKRYLETLLSVDYNKKYENLFPYGEPMLGPRGLYPTLGSSKVIESYIIKMNYLLNFSDGKNDLCDIAEKSQFSILELAEAARPLVEKGLLKEI